MKQTKQEIGYVNPLPLIRIIIVGEVGVIDQTFTNLEIEASIRQMNNYRKRRSPLYFSQEQIHFLFSQLLLEPHINETYWLPLLIAGYVGKTRDYHQAWKFKQNTIAIPAFVRQDPKPLRCNSNVKRKKQLESIVNLIRSEHIKKI